MLKWEKTQHSCSFTSLQPVVVHRKQC